MIILLRYILISFIVYLIIRSFMRFGKGETPVSKGSGPDKGDTIKSKGVSKKIGEYVDYEEVDK